MRPQMIAEGMIDALAVNGEWCERAQVAWDGFVGDTHSHATRSLSGHDGYYIKAFGLPKGAVVRNWRTVTFTSFEEIEAVRETLGLAVFPTGTLLENLVTKGIPNLSTLEPNSLLVVHDALDPAKTLAAFRLHEENGPCATVGARLQALYPDIEKLTAKFVKAAQQKRGMMGEVLYPGAISVGDIVRVYSPEGGPPKQ